MPSHGASDYTGLTVHTVRLATYIMLENTHVATNTVIIKWAAIFFECRKMSVCLCVCVSVCARVCAYVSMHIHTSEIYIQVSSSVLEDVRE